MFCGARIAALRNLYEVCGNIQYPYRYRTQKCTSFGVGYPVFFKCVYGMRLWVWYAWELTTRCNTWAGGMRRRVCDTVLAPNRALTETRRTLRARRM